MTISRAQMYRQLYQMGGIGTLPMDFGQSLQVPQQQQPSFSSAQNITVNPLLNYGQPQLGQAGGTPLTMAGGGISRLGYQEGGMGMEQMMQPSMQEQMMQPPMQPQMQDPMMAQAPQIDPSQMDPKQALEIIIQMLIAQGIPPEQAREIAIQMVQAVAEGGMGEMSDERVEARFGGRIGYAGGGLTSIDRARDMLQSRAPSGEFLAYINPQEAGILKLMGGAGEDVNVRGVPSFFFKSITKAISSGFKGITGAVKKIVGSDIGKLALTAAAIYAGGGGSFFGYTPFAGATPGFALSNLPGGSFLVGSSAGDAAAMGTRGIIGQGGFFDLGAGTLFSGGASSLLPGKGTLAAFGLGTALGGFLGKPPKPEDFPNNEEYQKAVNQYKAQYQAAINNPNPQFAAGQFPNNPFYPQRAANGGRIGYQEGGIGNLIKQTTQEAFFGTPAMAIGGRIGYAEGSTSFEKKTLEKKGYGDMMKNMTPKEVSQLYDSVMGTFSRRFQAEGSIPMGEPKQNQVGVIELDYRAKGGFVPPIGIKEKADDIPAMLSNNEFVFTADAVRNAGEGNVNKGAERMYGLMKQLEAGGVV